MYVLGMKIKIDDFPPATSIGFDAMVSQYNSSTDDLLFCIGMGLISFTSDSKTTEISHIIE